jgi:hypothetical protein
MVDEYLKLMALLDADQSLPQGAIFECGDNDWSYEVSSNYESRFRDLIEFMNLPRDIVNGVIPRHKGFHAMFRHCVTESYSMFETFAADLWTRAVDVGPPRISKRAFKSIGDRKDAFLKKLPEMGFNISESLGEVLRLSECVSFGTIEKIDISYGFLLNDEFLNPKKENGKRGCKTLAPGNDIRLLAAIRNAVVHNSGKVDDHFMKQTERFPDFRGVSKEQEIPIMADTIYRLLKCGLDTSTQLLTSTIKSFNRS